MVTFSSKKEAFNQLLDYAKEFVSAGGEGIIVRSKFLFHYSQFKTKVGKYVRENHVNTDEHWSHKELIQNNI